MIIDIAGWCVFLGLVAGRGVFSKTSYMNMPPPLYLPWKAVWTSKTLLEALSPKLFWAATRIWYLVPGSRWPKRLHFFLHRYRVACHSSSPTTQNSLNIQKVCRKFVCGRSRDVHQQQWWQQQSGSNSSSISSGGDGCKMVRVEEKKSIRLYKYVLEFIHNFSLNVVYFILL